MIRIKDEEVESTDNSPTLSISADGGLTGSTGVNRLNGKRPAEGKTLFGPLATTRRAGPPAAMKRESEFLKRPRQATLSRRDGDGLHLPGPADEMLLVFRAVSE